MHDPLVVIWDVPLPMPRRIRWRDGRGERRWGFVVQCRTNPENLGERVYPWWRPIGYGLRLAGRAYGLYTVATIWHREPNGRDSGEVCKHLVRDSNGKFVRWSHAWKFHVWHWKVQVHALQHLRKWLFARCPGDAGQHQEAARRGGGMSPVFGSSVYRLCIVILLVTIVLQLSQVIGTLQAILEKLVYG